MKTKMNIWKMLLVGLLLAGAPGCQLLSPRPTEAPNAAVAVTATAAAAPATADATATENPTATAEAATAIPAATVAAVTTVEPPPPDEIDALLALRSVRITLKIDREGDGSRELAAEIDGAGNMRIANISTGTENNLPEEMYVGMSAVQHEFIIAAGQAYRRDGEGGQWAPAPGLADYLERSLRGSEGPGLWMRLAQDARQPRGSEEAGGFRTQHYAFSKLIDVDTASGDLWVDEASGALVRAELEIPGVLFTHSNGGVHYPVKITLEVVPAEVEPVKLP